ncbi:MAG: tyrosinase family protein [Acetobacteraceae bacterium]|nr:tyrosinase family protein [Acetobacteraceae bacterium]
MSGAAGGRIRKEVRSLGDTWNETTLWYAKAVAALEARPIAQKTSWRYLAAMHGIDTRAWQQLGYLRSGETLPPQAEQRKYWLQCQHQSWYFLPWHRAYLLSFEDIVRAAIAELKGPPDWALPYWNYSSTTVPHALDLPPAFTQANLPDGSRNPLHVQARFGRSVNADDADLNGRITETAFVGADGTAQLGFGGPRTPFSLSGTEEGLLEAQPHDLVHVDVGGRGGLMSSPVTAALDPIFWLHHANIDRLWEVWRRRDEEDENPTEPAWLNGPSDRAFAIFDANGSDRPSRPEDMIELAPLGYEYDDVSDPLPGVTRRNARLLALAPQVQAFAAHQLEAEPMPNALKGEILGSNDKSLALGPEPITTRVTLAAAPASTFMRSFTASSMRADTPGEPDRVFLRLENIRGREDSAVFDVFVKAPGQQGGDGTKVGSISLFGLEQASRREGEHAGTGLTKTLEITRAMDALGADRVRPEALEVRIVPRSDVRREDEITVGQVTIHRVSGQ